jgi:hypothetical protein
LISNCTKNKFFNSFFFSIRHYLFCYGFFNKFIINGHTIHISSQILANYSSVTYKHLHNTFLRVILFPVCSISFSSIFNQFLTPWCVEFKSRKFSIVHAVLRSDAPVLPTKSRILSFIVLLTFLFSLFSISSSFSGLLNLNAMGFLKDKKKIFIFDRGYPSLEFFYKFKNIIVKFIN